MDNFLNKNQIKKLSKLPPDEREKVIDQAIEGLLIERDYSSEDEEFGIDQISDELVNLQEDLDSNTNDIEEMRHK